MILPYFCSIFYAFLEFFENFWFFSFFDHFWAIWSYQLQIVIFPYYFYEGLKLEVGQKWSKNEKNQKIFRFFGDQKLKILKSREKIWTHWLNKMSPRIEWEHSHPLKSIPKQRSGCGKIKMLLLHQLSKILWFGSWDWRYHSILKDQKHIISHRIICFILCITFV